jgi:hypothetical protein
MAIASFVLALFSILIGPLGFVPAIICGHRARSRLRRDASLAGGGFATAGLVIGYTFLTLFIVLSVSACLFWHLHFHSLLQAS